MVLKDFSYCYSLVTTNVFMAYWLDELLPFWKPSPLQAASIRLIWILKTEVIFIVSKFYFELLK
jgi:hypothetical protein